MQFRYKPNPKKTLLIMIESVINAEEMDSLPTPTTNFIIKKTAILKQLSLPDSEYADASPKGSVDAGIRQLIDEINDCPGLVTTSSCAGRVSVYLEGRKKFINSNEVDGDVEGAVKGGDQIGAEGRAASSAGGKGGGEWLFVSHDPVDELEDRGGYQELFGMLGGTPSRGISSDAAARLIHFKFEPMACFPR